MISNKYRHGTRHKPTLFRLEAFSMHKQQNQIHYIAHQLFLPAADIRSSPLRLFLKRLSSFPTDAAAAASAVRQFCKRSSRARASHDIRRGRRYCHDIVVIFQVDRADADEDDTKIITTPTHKYNIVICLAAGACREAVDHHGASHFVPLYQHECLRRA